MSSPVSASHYEAELDAALDAGRRAAALILEFYDAKSAGTYIKSDGSPVTDADLASDRAIRETIRSRFPNDALLTEEGANDPARLSNRRCWIVDPIDGTAQFVGRTGMFDVMIALAIDGRVEVAVAVQPVTGLVQVAVRGDGAWEIREGDATPFRIEPSSTPPRLVASKWYQGNEMRDVLARVARDIGAKPPPVLEVGFQSRNLSDQSRTLDGFIGLPPDSHISIAQEWDLAAVDLIVTEAGGCFTDCWGRPHTYNKRNTGISGGLLVASDPDLHQRLVGALRQHLGEPPPPDPADDPLIRRT